MVPARAELVGWPSVKPHVHKITLVKRGGALRCCCCCCCCLFFEMSIDVTLEAAKTSHRRERDKRQQRRVQGIIKKDIG